MFCKKCCSRLGETAFLALGAYKPGISRHHIVMQCSLVTCRLENPNPKLILQFFGLNVAPFPSPSWASPALTHANCSPAALKTVIPS